MATSEMEEQRGRREKGGNRGGKGGGEVKRGTVKRHGQRQI